MDSGAHDPNPPFVGYLGEIFWDQDMHMFPAMLPLFPDLALAGASFRAAPERTRAGRATARHMGFAGAKIPVETTDGYVRATMLLTFRRRPTN